MSNSPSDTINARVKPELDMDTFFDFNQSTTQASPMIGSSADAMSSFGDSKERQQYNGPSHAYDQYKQQVGLPMGSVANLPPMSQQQSLEGFNSGAAGDMAFDSGFGAGWSSGIDIDSDMAMDFGNPASAMPAMFFPSPAANDAAANDSFINPNNIQEEQASTVRLWPGVHSQRAQQAAMQKALQVQAAQQRQMKLQAQQAHYQRHASNASQSQIPPQPTPTSTSKRASHAAPTDPHVEESISRLLSQMRQQSNASADEDGLDMLPHIARLKKDEEEMDEDERLLNSEEGKKLSSKERRQLRNKVSARAFRSRRKEYISQLEGEVAMKTQEANQLRHENQQLMQENDRYRGLIETLLRHKAFTPFIQDISNDPAVLAMPQQHTQHLQPQPQQQQQQQQQQPVPTPAPQPQQQQQQQQRQESQPDVKPEFLNFDASQLQIPTSQPSDSQQVSLAMVPEENFSKLNLSASGRMNGLDFTSGFNNSVNAYAVTNLPPGPDPSDLLLDLQSPAVDRWANGSMSGLLEKLDDAARRMGPAWG